ncbi:SpoIIE family protein phosphatase [Nocardioides pacificus]
MQHTFLGEGDLGRDLLAVEWESTPLGPIDTWPGSLKAVVRMVLASRFSMWMAWGEELNFLCNEAYRRDTLGTKYPWALGRPASEVWSEIWPDIGPRIERVLTTGEATWDKSLLLFLERSGYPEETYHTFSYSPLADDDGAIAGMLCVVSEDTEEVIAHRRMQTLRDLGARNANLTEAETVSAACRQLRASDRCLPFTLTYLYDADGVTARLAGQTGFGAQQDDHPAAPALFRVGAPGAVWPAPPAEGERPVLVDDLGERFADLPTGAWDVPPSRATVLALTQAGQAAPYGFQVVGLNPYRPYDQDYADFLALVSGQLAAAITDARAYEFERRRAETLAELDQAKTDFFTNVSHEFRTPLTLLLGPAEDAVSDSADPLPPRQRERVEVVLRNGKRLLKLVNTLLDFSRLESGRIDASFEPVDLADYTRELASMFVSAAERLGLTLTIDCPPLPEAVFVDRDLWGKIVLNLMSNALKFTMVGGITLRVEALDDGALLSVTDTGTGIPFAEQQHVFERFRRVQGASSRTHEGSGIGLSLVAELAELHGGSVAVESTPGEGSTFTVWLPWGAQHLPAEHVGRSGGAVAEQVVDGFLAEAAQLVSLGSPDAPRATRQSPLSEQSRRPRILVVDDNPDIRHYVRGLLDVDYEVLLAQDGLDGLEKARAAQPDLVLTDVMMPRMNGFELLAALQADPATLGVPVVMLSARAGEEGTLEGLEAGADDYLVKPFTARELAARVRSNLELDRARRTRRQLEESQSLLDQAQRLAQVGSWEIELATGRVETSAEYRRLTGVTREQIDRLGFPAVITELVHPDDFDMVMGALDEARDGVLVDLEFRLIRTDGVEIVVAVNGERVTAPDGTPLALRGSVQDVTQRRLAAQALALNAASAEASAREHAIADELQASLLPQRDFDLEHLEVATYYRAGVEGTQVGGDWYDVIELGAGRTALVVGDVMGRGVRAAAVMGQLRAAVRAYARLDLPPADLLESLDGLVRDLGQDQIVTCLYAVFDPAEGTLHFANAGHLPPIVTLPDGSTSVLSGSEDPPLGVGLYNMTPREVTLPPGSTVVLYTDGLVERRGEDLDAGIASLRDLVERLDGPLKGAPEQLVDERLPDGPDDDVAVLVARVDWPVVRRAVSLHLDVSDAAPTLARRLVGEHLGECGLSEGVIDDALLVTSELVTNAILHAASPVELRLRADDDEVLIEVLDNASYEPRKQRPDADDEHGRGLQIVAAVCDRWGTRPTDDGKVVWCVLTAQT